MWSPELGPEHAGGCPPVRHSGAGCARPGPGSGVALWGGLPPSVPAGVVPLVGVPGWAALVAEKPGRLLGRWVRPLEYLGVDLPGHELRLSPSQTVRCVMPVLFC